MVVESLNKKIEKYLEDYKIDSRNPHSNEYFAVAVKIALKEYNLPIIDVANAFQVAPSTVERWASGVAIPFPSLRDKIIEWLYERI
jgi:hypothetical protein